MTCFSKIILFIFAGCVIITHKGLAQENELEILIAPRPNVLYKTMDLKHDFFLKENSLNLQTAMSAIQRTLDTAYITVQW